MDESGALRLAADGLVPGILDRNVPIQGAVSRQVDLAHAADTEKRADLVTSLQLPHRHLESASF